MQFVGSRVPISSEPAGPLKYAFTPTGLRRLRLPRARLKPQVRSGRARQHSLARRGGRACKLNIPASPPGITAPEPSASNIALEAAANLTTATISKPVDGASSTPTSGAAEKQRAPVSGRLAISAGYPQFLTPQPNNPVSLAPSAPWLTLTSQTGASGTTTRQLPLLNLIIVAKLTSSDTCDTTPPYTTYSAQPSSALLACAASPWPTPLANPTGSVRADDANYSATTSSEPMTRARARGSPIKTVAVPTTLPPLDQTIFEHVSLDEPPRAAFKHSTVTESLADSFQFVI